MKNTKIRCKKCNSLIDRNKCYIDYIFDATDTHHIFPHGIPLCRNCYEKTEQYMINAMAKFYRSDYYK